MRKRIMIGAGIAALVLIIVLCVILFASPGRGKAIENFDTDSAYGYTFTASRRGLTVTVTGGKEGYGWTAKSLSNIVTVGDADVEGDRTSFLLSPAGNGTCRVEFTLCDAADPSKRAYQLYADLLVADKDVTVVSSGHQLFAEDIVDPDGRFTVTMQERGSYLVCMMPALDADWSWQTESSSVLVDGYDLWTDPNADTPETDKSKEPAHSLTMSTYFTLKCVGSEPATVYIYDRNHPKALEIKLEFDEEQGLIPAECAMVSFDSGHSSKVPANAGLDPYAAFDLKTEQDEEAEETEGTEETEKAGEAEKAGSEEKP